MQTDATSHPRVRLAEMRKHAGYSVSKVASALGYSAPSGYHRYERDTWGDKKIPHDIIKRLIPLFRGAGSPPITFEEMMEISDVKDNVPISKVSSFVASLVDDGGAGLLSVQYRIEEAQFSKGMGPRMLGASTVGTSRDFPASSQFVVAVSTRTGSYAAGTQLHVVRYTEFSQSAMVGRCVFIATPYAATDLYQFQIGTVGSQGDVYDADGAPVEGTIIGVVVGYYRKIGTKEPNHS